MFFKHNDGKVAILIVYVDDIILTGDDIVEIERLKVTLAKEFEVKNLGEMRYFLGMEVARSKEGIYISQRKYILDLLKETGMLGCKPCDTPIEVAKYTDDGNSVDKGRYQRIVGKLIYLSHTRPDITFAVSVASRHMSTPKERHLEAVYRILRYLKSTAGKGLMFRKYSSRTVEIFTDSDWAGSVEDRKSTSGFCAFIMGNLVAWQSKKQKIVARSSAEAEIRSLADGICEGLWYKRLLEEVKIRVELPIKFYCDSKSALSMAINPVQHGRSKHIDVDRHLISDYVNEGVVCLTYVPTEKQTADIFTKGLPKKLFESCISKLDMINIYDPT